MNKKTGFTLIEILFVLLVIVLLVAIAVPNFMKAQNEIKKMTCISNLKSIDDSVNRYSSSYKKALGTPVYFTDLVPAYLKVRPECPSKGTYYITVVGSNPTCSKSDLGHELPTS